MNKKRFENDKELNYIYEKLNSSKFRNYIYDFDGKGSYCNYIDLYECKIDDLKQALNEIREYVHRVADKGYNFGLTLEPSEINHILQIIDKVLGGK